MIATGRQVFNDKSSKSVEIFDMVTENLRTCTKVQSFPFESLEDASGGIVDGSPIICGGYTGKGSTRYDRTTCHSREVAYETHKAALWSKSSSLKPNFRFDNLFAIWRPGGLI